MTTTTTNNHGGKRPGAGRKPKTEQRDDISEFHRARTRKETALAQIREYEAGERGGQLYGRGEVLRVIATSIAVFTEQLRSLPDSLERRAGLSPGQCELAERVVDGELEALRERLLATVTGKTPPEALGEALRAMLANIEPGGTGDLQP
jgi:hypothetical protein